MTYYGNIEEDATVRIPFNTFSSNDPAASVTVTNLADDDIKVHKDGSATPIATDGATIVININGITGCHVAVIDTSADAAYSTGSDYMVRLEGITVDAGTLNPWIGSFSIENRFMRGTDSAATATALATAQTAIDAIPTTMVGTDNAATSAKQDTMETTLAAITAAGPTKTQMDTAHALLATPAQVNAQCDTSITDANLGSLANQATIDSLCNAIKQVTDALPNAGALTGISTSTDRLTAVRAAVLTDWINDGRLDVLLDAIPTTMVGTDNAALASVCTEVRLATLTDWINDGRLDVILDAIKVVTDALPDSGALTSIGTDAARLTAVRAAVLTDWINDGRLDVLLDAVKVVTDALTSSAAAKLALSAGTIVSGIVDTVTNTHTPTTTEFQADDITEATADHFNGRVVIFTSGVLQNQATKIEDYAAVGGIGQFTVTAMTEAPANNDTFIIV